MYSSVLNQKNPLIFEPKLGNKSIAASQSGREMSIITLISDLGDKDHYAGALKGFILKHAPQAHLVDITHHVQPFNILQAAFFARNVISDFPEGTIHLIAVNPDPVVNFGRPEDGKFPTIMKFRGQYFVATDNGIFSLILRDQEPDAIFRIEHALSSADALRFPAKNILGKAAALLASGKQPEELGEQVAHFNKAFAVNPVIEDLIIKGTIIHIDHYGNGITNITEDLFQRVGKDEPFTIYFRRKEYYIDEISHAYGDVPEGEKLALFNSSGYLEIAINKGVSGNGGGANSLLGLHLNDVVRIEFQPRGSRSTIDSLF
jgi:S-adenosyl-L-methionine hydrolase (adenosine-forming)